MVHYANTRDIAENRVLGKTVKVLTAGRVAIRGSEQ